MNVFLLVVALAAPVGAPKAGLPAATAASAAVASEAVLPEARAVSGGETHHSSDRFAAASPVDIPPQVSAMSEVETTLPCKGTTSGGADVPPAQITTAAIPLLLGVWSAAVSGGPCTLVDIYAKRRMLSGPWSASRRLEAARIRGNEDEAKRMEAMLDDFVGKALEVEGTEQ